MNQASTIDTHTEASDQVISAWILQIADDIEVSISQYEMDHIDEFSELTKVPKAPAWCNEIAIWKNNIVPVFDLAKLSGALSQDNTNLVALVRIFNEDGSSFSYAAIKIQKPPLLEKSSSFQKCEKHDVIDILKDISIAAFKRNDKAIPVIDISKLAGISTGQ